MNEQTKQKILEVLNVFETGSKKGNYANISIFKDGPNDMRQITYGRSQTTEFGNLKDLVASYADANGKYSAEFEKWVGRVGKKPSLYSNVDFKELLRKAGKDPVMVQVQDDFFEKKYWQPAKKWFDDHKFQHPLSMLVIYDSFIHSGGILSFLRKRFRATPDDEKAWITQYVHTRHEWLRSHRRPILRKTIYRTKTFLALIADDNWGLNKRFRSQGNTWEADTETYEPEEATPLPKSMMQIKLPVYEKLKTFYKDKDHLAWFSFPVVVRMPSGDDLVSRVGDGRSDYVCHYTVKNNLESALKEVYEFLGEAKYRSEGWDIFGGGYDANGSLDEQLAVKFIFNPAVDDKPIFTDEAVDIMERYGFLNLGRATGKHFGTFVAYIPDYKEGDYYSKIGLPDYIKKV